VAACLAVTILDGLVLARSAFEHSANNRSVMLLGTFSPLSAHARAPGDHEQILTGPLE
jgi:nitroimidazol reductase NimA-like FMN-containing flavoprotein (pyridoxamine 5'-phosphate oxidase superfamily)